MFRSIAKVLWSQTTVERRSMKTGNRERERERECTQRNPRSVDGSDYAGDGGYPLRNWAPLA